MPSPVAYAIQVITLAVWLTCVGMGMTGLVLGWPPPSERKVEPPAMEATLIETPLEDQTPDAVASPDQAPPSKADDPPPPPDLPELPPLPELPAFVERATPPAPLTIPKVKPEKPKPVRSDATQKTTASSGKPGVQNLTMGVGEGRQPRPPYPSAALSRHQEGTVMIQLLVGADGNVLSAEVWQASPWPLLNEAALSTVRSHWQFSKGAVRLFRVPIRFHIQ